MQSRLSFYLQNQLAAQFEDFTAKFLESIHQLLSGSGNQTSLNAQQIQEPTPIPAEASVHSVNVNSLENQDTEDNQRLESFIAATASRELNSRDPVQVQGQQEISAAGPEIRNLRSRQVSSVESESVRSEYFSTKTLQIKSQQRKLSTFKAFRAHCNSTPIDQVLTLNFFPYF